MEPKQSDITQLQTIYSKKIQTLPSRTKIKKEKIRELKMPEIRHLKEKIESLEQLKNRLEDFQIDQKNINQKLERENNQIKKEQFNYMQKNDLEINKIKREQFNYIKQNTLEINKIKREQLNYIKQNTLEINEIKKDISNLKKFQPISKEDFLSSFKDLKSEIDILKKNIQQQDLKIDGLQKKMAQKDSEIDGLQKKLKLIDSKIDGLQKKTINFEKTNLNLEKKENDQLGNNSQNKYMENWIQKIIEELNIINKKINEQKIEIKNQNVKIDKLESKLSVIAYRDSIRDVLFFLLSLSKKYLRSSKH